MSDRFSFYRAMLLRAQLCHTVSRLSIRLSARLSVCLSVTFMYRNHRMEYFENNFSEPLLGLTQHGRSDATRTPPNLGWNRGGVTQERKQSAHEVVRDRTKVTMMF